MKVHAFGTHVKVIVAKCEVQTFAQKWPGFGPAHAMQIEFNMLDWSLVDLQGDRPEMDGTGVLAIVEDAERFAQGLLEKKEGGADALPE